MPKIASPTLIQLPTAQFMPSGVTPAQASLANTWYAYVPDQCQSTECRLHVALHGCDQDPTIIGMDFVLETGYIEYAKANDMVILAPATINSLLSPSNPQGCWDWYEWRENTLPKKLDWRNC